MAMWREAEGHGTLRRPQEKKAQAAGCTGRDVRIKVCQLQNVAWSGHRGGGSLLPPPPASPLAPAQHPALPAPLLPPKAGELVQGTAAFRGTAPVAPGLRGYLSPFGTQPACWEGAEAKGTWPPVTQWTQCSHIPPPSPEGRETAMMSPRSRHPGPRMENFRTVITTTTTLDRAPVLSASHVSVTRAPDTL